jgi:hypothetical protein
MFPPAPPQNDPPPQEDGRYQDDVADIRRFHSTSYSERVRILAFALIGGGIASMACGLVYGIMLVATTPDSRYGDFALRPYSPVFVVVTTMATLAPFLFLLFGMAAATQVIASSIIRAANRAARVLAEAAKEGPRRREED